MTDVDSANPYEPPGIHHDDPAISNRQDDAAGEPQAASSKPQRLVKRWAGVAFVIAWNASLAASSTCLYLIWPLAFEDGQNLLKAFSALDKAQNVILLTHGWLLVLIACLLLASARLRSIVFEPGVTFSQVRYSLWGIAVFWTAIMTIGTIGVIASW